MQDRAMVGAVGEFTVCSGKFLGDLMRNIRKKGGIVNN